jgi:hypothetical protein
MLIDERASLIDEEKRIIADAFLGVIPAQAHYCPE